MTAWPVALLALLIGGPPFSQEAPDTALFLAAYRQVQPGLREGRTVLAGVRVPGPLLPGQEVKLEELAAASRTAVGRALGLEPVPPATLDSLVLCPEGQRRCEMAPGTECVVSFDVEELESDRAVLWVYWTQHEPLNLDGRWPWLSRQVRVADSRGAHLELRRTPDGSWRVERVIGYLRG